MQLAHFRASCRLCSLPARSRNHPNRFAAQTVLHASHPQTLVGQNLLHRAELSWLTRIRFPEVQFAGSGPFRNAREFRLRDGLPLIATCTAELSAMAIRPEVGN